jgi:hypothetical protein
MSYDTAKSKCPSCGYKVDSASSQQDEKFPEAGDIAICLNCAQANVFNADLTVREATMKEIMNLNKFQVRRLEMVQRAIRASPFFRNLAGN